MTSFILHVCGPQRAVVHVTVPEPSPVGSYGTRGSAGALPSREAGSGTMGHMAAPETSTIGRRV
jgi:hypothetical protein